MVFQWLSWIFLASYAAGFEIDGIYPISGGLGEVTIYGSNLNDLNDLRFRSETIQGMLLSVNITVKSYASQKDIKLPIGIHQSRVTKRREMAIFNFISY